MYGYKLVARQDCDSASALLPDPPCLRTSAQMSQLRTAAYPDRAVKCASAAFKANNPGICGPIRAERCFGSGVWVSLSAWLVLAVAVAASFALLG